MLVHTSEKLGRRHHGVVSIRLVDCARMRGLSQTNHLLVAHVAADTRNDANALGFRTVKCRPLLDVKLNECRNLFKLDQRTTRRDVCRYETAGRDAFAECRGLCAVLESRIGKRELAGERQ